MWTPTSKIQMEGVVLVDLRLGREERSTSHTGNTHLSMRFRRFRNTCFVMSWFFAISTFSLFRSYMSFNQLITFNKRISKCLSCGFNDGTYGRPYCAAANIAHGSCRPKGAAFTQTRNT